MAVVSADESWTSHVVRRFGLAAEHYNGSATLQCAVANRLAGHCNRVTIPAGLWVDLGSGTGLLADALEHQHPGVNVLRLDGSAEMLARQSSGKSTLAIDLSGDLPPWPNAPTLLASSFTLQWLPSPARILRHWYDCLAPGGWLALAVPIRGSFRQWHTAAKAADLPCSALPLEDPDDLIETIPNSAVRISRILPFTQQADRAIHLLKPMTAVGAGSTPNSPLTTADWRRLFRAWPKEGKDGRISLTWHVLLLLIQR